MYALAAISIPFGPNIVDFGPFILAWHGFFTFVAVATSVYLAVRWGTKQGLSSDAIYSIAVWAIIGGIVGARVVHVIDFWGTHYQNNLMAVFQVWQGGIAIYGGILGGFAGGSLYVIIRNSDRFLAMWGSLYKVMPFLGEPNKAPLPSIGLMADITTPALLISMAIGRVGDIINGEHFAKATDLAWGFIYTNASSPGYQQPAAHPAVAYELIFDLLLLAAIWPLRNRLRPHGMYFVMYGGLYSMGRFFLSFLRIEQVPYFDVLNQAQIIALIVMAVAIPLVVFKAQFVRPTQTTETRRRGQRRAG